MLYQLRTKDGVEPSSSGTLRLTDGKAEHLKLADFRIEVLAHWTSPRTKAKYPAKWKLSVPSKELELTVTPLLADQELETPGASGVNYWEGLCRFEGTRAGKKVEGRGYVELVGYA